MVKTENLKRMLKPGSVAWFGGGGIAPAINYMQRNGFSGQALAVSPKRDEIAGVPCIRSVAELPRDIDLAILVIPKEAVIEIVRALSDKGCGGVICVSSGFSESEGGDERQSELIAAAREMPVVGPNCPGIGNFLDSSAFMMDHFGAHNVDRGIAVISNGGAYLSDLGCADRSQPIAYLIGLGNQAMVNIADMLDVILDDNRVTAVNIYFESITDTVKLSRAALKAVKKRIPIVVIKGGKSDTGKRAAQSHTASLAGDSSLASALFRRFGWIEVSTPSEAIETLKMLCFTSRPEGMRAGFVTSSGSYAVIGGDIAEKAGLQIVPPDSKLDSILDESLPEYVGPANPLDISDAHGWAYENQLEIYREFVRNNYDLFVQVMCYPPEHGWDITTWDTTTKAFAEATKQRPAAFVNTLAESLPCVVRERMISEGVAPLQGLEDGLRAVSNAARFGVSDRSVLSESILLESQAVESNCQRQLLSEVAAKSLLSEAGLDLPQRWIVEKPVDLPQFSSKCVLKAIIPELLHKSDVGAVALNLTAAEVPNAMDEMKKKLGDQNLCCKKYLVEEMVEGVVAELLVGIRRVPEFGFALTFAVGGVAVELIQDSATILLPALRDEIASTLLNLRLAPLLQGYRGRAVVDIDLVLKAVDRLFAFVRSHPQTLELEINPLLVTDTRVVIVDAIIIQSSGEKHE